MILEDLNLHESRYNGVTNSEFVAVSSGRMSSFYVNYHPGNSWGFEHVPAFMQFQCQNGVEL